jgi:hypothetical protein
MIKRMWRTFSVIALLLCSTAAASPQTAAWSAGPYTSDGAGNIKLIGAETYLRQAESSPQRHRADVLNR